MKLEERVWIWLNILTLILKDPPFTLVLDTYFFSFTFDLYFQVQNINILNFTI